MFYRHFVPGARYEVVSPLNCFNTWIFTAISRGEKSVTFRADSGEIRTLPVHIWAGSDGCPFELVIFKVGRKNVRLSACRGVRPSASVSGSRFSL